MEKCGKNCCAVCDRLDECGGCDKCGGHPFGGNCIVTTALTKGDSSYFEDLKIKLIDTVNSLSIENLHINELFLLNGFYVNLEYPLKNGQKVKFLNDNDVYLGNQIEIKDSDRCLGVVTNGEILVVCEYGCMGENPELLLYKKL